MGIWACSVTKRGEYKGVQENFANVYHYLFPTLNEPGDMTVALAEDLLDECITAERGLHSSNIQFIGGRVWGPVDQGALVSDTVGIFDRNLPGTASTRSPGMSLLDCYVVSMRTDRQDARSRPVYLRKYLRLLTGPGGASASALQLQHMAQLTSADRDGLVAYADDIAGVTIGTIGSGGAVGVLCAPSGAQVPAEAPRPVDVGDWIETHDLRY